MPRKTFLALYQFTYYDFNIFMMLLVYIIYLLRDWDKGSDPSIFIIYSPKLLRMEILDLIKKRKSVRSFKNKMIPAEMLAQVLEAGRLAPSSVNLQPWCFIVVDDKELLGGLYQAYPRDWFKTAPQVIVICGNHQESWKRSVDKKDHCDIDVAIATDHITLMATYLGLSTCWVCNFEPYVVRELLSLPVHLEPIVLLPIGFASEEHTVENKKRKDFNQVSFINKINTPFEAG